MVSVLASGVVDCRFEPYRIKPKTIKLVFVASPLSMQQHYGERVRTGWLGIRIMCSSGATCQSATFCFGNLAL